MRIHVFVFDKGLMIFQIPRLIVTILLQMVLIVILFIAVLEDRSSSHSALSAFLGFITNQASLW